VSLIIKDPLKIVIIGYTNVGKTWYFGSIVSANYKTGPEGFTLVSKNPLAKSKVEETSEVLYSNNQQQKVEVFSTTGIDPSKMTLKKGGHPIVDISILDTEGQAIEKDRNPETGKKILNQIKNCDGLILALKVPINNDEFYYTKKQLLQLINLTGDLLKIKTVPVCCVFNQIDRLNVPTDKSIEERNTFLLNELKQNSFLSVLVREFNLFSVTARKAFPNKLFLSTSIGFDNTSELKQPFGGRAAFFWLIAEIFKSKSNKGLQKLYKNSKFSKLSQQLYKDINYLNKVGESVGIKWKEQKVD